MDITFEELSVEEVTKILSIDSDTKKISLGIKQLEKDPWKDMDDKFKQNEKNKGKISQITQITYAFRQICKLIIS